MAGTTTVAASTRTTSSSTRWPGGARSTATTSSTSHASSACSSTSTARRSSASPRATTLRPAGGRLRGHPPLHLPVGSARAARVCGPPVHVLLIDRVLPVSRPPSLPVETRSRWDNRPATFSRTPVRGRSAPITSRRRFLQAGLGAGAALLLPRSAATAVARAAPGGRLRKYVQPLPCPETGSSLRRRAAATTTRSPRPRSHGSSPPTSADAVVGVRRRLRVGRPGRARSAWRSWPDRRAADGRLHPRPARHLPELDPGRTRLTPLGREFA